MLPLAASPAAVYGVAGIAAVELSQRERRPCGERLLSLSVDAQGRLARDAVPLPPPPQSGDLAVTSAVLHAGKLFVSTKRTGLLAYDIAAGTWKQITPGQGLPEWYVDYVHPLDEKTLVVATGEPGKGRVSYSTLDVVTSQIKLIHRLDGHQASFCAWRQGERLMAISRYGLACNLLGQPRWLLKWPYVRPYGWQLQSQGVNPITSTAAVGDKRYVMSYAGLHEIDGNCEVVRSWWCRRTCFPRSQDPVELARNLIVTPGDFPTDHRPRGPRSRGSAGVHHSERGPTFFSSARSTGFCATPLLPIPGSGRSGRRKIFPSNGR